MSTPTVREVWEVSYWQDIYAERDGVRQYLGRRLMTGQVEVTVSVKGLVNMLAAQACRSKGGKSQVARGLVVCKRIGQPTETKRELRHQEG